MSNFDIINFELEQTYSIISSRIKHYVATQHKLLHPFIDAILYSSLLKGKMVRPFLCLSFAKIFATESEEFINLATAIELTHVYSLIHDDLPAMDNAKLRRGSTTLHLKYDQATAILAGDALQSLSFEILAENNNRYSLRLIKEFAKAIGVNGMVGGQYIDLKSNNIIKKESISIMQRLKTGKLIMFSCLAPAILLGLNADIENLIRNYAEKLGESFQIRDDYLDRFGSSVKLGKPLNQDSDNDRVNSLNDLSKSEADILLEEKRQEVLAALSDFPDNYNLDLLVTFSEYLFKRES